MTTVALVALASAGTGILVSHTAKQLTQQPRTHATAAARAPQLPTVAPPVLVDRAPGSFALPPVAHRPAPAPEAPLPAPFTPLPEVAGPVDVPPAVTPPAVEPPVLEPPVVAPPVLEPPVVQPPATSRRQPSFVPRLLWPSHDQAKPRHVATATATPDNRAHPTHPAHPAHPAAAQDGDHPGPDHDARADEGKHNGQGKKQGD